jgi:hypothetical protein
MPPAGGVLADSGVLIRPSAPEEDLPGNGSISAESLHAIAFPALGLWILVALLPEALNVGSQALGLALTDLPGWRGPLGLRLSLQIIGVLVRAAIGVYLLFGGAGLASFARRSWALARSHPAPGRGSRDPSQGR